MRSSACDHKIICPEVIGPSDGMRYGASVKLHIQMSLLSGEVRTKGYELLQKVTLEDLRMHCAESSRLCASSRMSEIAARTLGIRESAHLDAAISW